MRSMTGYGKARTASDSLEIAIEIKSVNSRYLDLSIKLPTSLSALEMRMREKIRESVIRGKISVFVNLKRGSISDSDTIIDDNKFQERHLLLKSLKNTLNLDDNITLDHLLSFPDIFELDLEALDPKLIQVLIDNTLIEALNAFNSMREMEGEHIKKDMQNRNAIITNLLDEVEKNSKLNVKMEFNRLLDGVHNLIANNKIDKDRLEQEIAIISDKVDITEECVRMRSHLNLFSETLVHNGEVGKKLNFILQEMLREANTMNSKTSDINVSHAVIKIKEEIEKLREQAQNIE